MNFIKASRLHYFMLSEEEGLWRRGPLLCHATPGCLVPPPGEPVGDPSSLQWTQRLNMPILKAVSAWLLATLTPFGGLGLMMIAIGDSSFLSLPEVNDILLMTFSINTPERMLEM